MSLTVVLQGRPDAEVMSLARSEARVLISADVDFGELLVKSAALVPSLILNSWMDGRSRNTSLLDPFKPGRNR